MAKQLVFSDEARRSLIKGVDTLAKAVVTTLGPKSRNVALDRKFGSPTITHDGVTVAKEIELEDPFENMGAQLLKEAATKTNDIAGDGTTTATVLAHALVVEGSHDQPFLSNHRLNHPLPIRPGNAGPSIGQPVRAAGQNQVQVWRPGRVIHPAHQP